MRKTRQKLLRVAFHASTLALALGIGTGAAHAGFGPAQGAPSGNGGTPGGAAGGDLGGTYPNPTVVSLSDVTNTLPAAAFPLRGPNGTAAAPTFSFSGETGSGMFDSVGGVNLSVTGTSVLAVVQKGGIVFGNLNLLNGSAATAGLSTDGFLLSASGSTTGATASTWKIADLAATFADNGVNSTSTIYGARVTPTINMTGASRMGHYEGLTVNAVETSLPTGSNYLMRLQAGAAGGTDKFTVTNTGATTVNVTTGSAVSLLVNGTGSNEQCYLAGTAAGGTTFSIQGPIVADGIARRLGTYLDTASAAAGTGGTFGIGGYANGVTAPTAFAELGGLKANGNAGDTQGYMVLGTRKANGGAIVEALRIDTSQTILIPSGNVFGISASSINTSAADFGISRASAAVGAIGNGSAADDTGTLQVAALTRKSAATGTAISLTGGAATAGNGGLASATGGAGVGTDKNAGGVTINTGASTGAGTALINFNAPPVAASGAGSNASVLVAKFARSTNTTTTNLNAYSFVANATGAALNTADQDGFIYVGSCAGTPTGTPTSFTGAVPLVADSTNNKLYFYSGGAWTQAGGAGATPSLGAVVNAGNVVNSVAASGQFTWATGGTYAAGTTSQLYGPTDTGMFITAGKPAGSAAGQALTLTGGLATTTGAGGLTSAVGGAAAGADQNAGGVTLGTGSSTGAGTGQLLFQVPVKAATGSSANATATVLTIDPSGFVYAGRQNATQTGSVSITASQGGSTSGAGGGASLIAGAAGTAGGATGVVTITAGANAIASGSTAGGAVNVTGGACTGTTSTGPGGAFVAAGGLGGTSSGLGGAASVTGGAGQGSTSGIGGLATLAGGAGSTGSNNNPSGGVLLSTGISSGTAFSNITARTSFTLAAGGSTAQTIGDRMMICGKAFVLSNTTGTATAFAVLSTTSGSGLGGTCFYTVVASDGTEWSSASGQFDFSVVNKAGTLTTATPLIQTENIANSTGATLATTGTPTVVASGSNVVLKVTPAFSGTNASNVTSCRVSWEIVLRGCVSTVTPQ